MQKFSLLDYPGEVSAIVFTPGCTMRCPFCYNPELVLGDPKLPSFPEENVLNFLAKRKGKLRALVITGGEPTLQPDLPAFVCKVKALGYLVKLDTNGSSPEVLKELIKKKLLDYVAMDLKTTWSRYKKLKPRVNLDNVRESVYLLKETENPPLCEFRTTVVPKLVDQETITMIARTLQGARKYVLQQYRPAKTLQPDFDQKVYPEEKLRAFQRIAEKYVREVEVRGI